MGRPPDKRSAPPGGSGASSRIIAVDSSDSSKHTRPARRKSRRPPGIGERTRARELRRRGLHLKLIEAWRP